MVVMPNHFHCIIENAPIMGDNVGTIMGDNVGTIMGDDVGTILGDHVGAPLRGRPEYGQNNQKYNTTIGDAMDWFKTMSTNEYIRGVKNHNWERFNKKLWQRNYWEHIIRNDAGYNRIANYINENPKKWNDDKFNPNNPD